MESQRRNVTPGWIPDLPDFRDHLYQNLRIVSQPQTVDLRSDMPPVYDQGPIGSCTANAIAAAIEYRLIAEGAAPWTPSRLFIYYNERAIEGTIDYDAGASLRDGFITINRQGACHASKWPYHASNYRSEPPPAAYDDARFHRALKYQRLGRNLFELQSALAEGRPFVFGATLYDSFMSKAVEATGIVPMPSADEKPVGGHAMFCVGYKGYSSSTARFIVRNSWGAKWGDAGYCYIPAAYLLHPNLCDDFWTVDVVERAPDHVPNVSEGGSENAGRP